MMTTTKSNLNSVWVGAALALAACTSPTDPDPGAALAGHLVGTWDLVALNNQPIPGWVRRGFLVDSSYIAAGRLTFQPGSLCSRTLTSDTDQPPSERRCIYRVSGNEASLGFVGDPTRFTISARRGSDDLTLWGPRCDIWAQFCSQHREDYRKRRE